MWGIFLLLLFHHPPVDGCLIVNCNFGALPGDECTSFLLLEPDASCYYFSIKILIVSGYMTQFWNETKQKATKSSRKVIVLLAKGTEGSIAFFSSFFLFWYRLDVWSCSSHLRVKTYPGLLCIELKSSFDFSIWSTQSLKTNISYSLHFFVAKYHAKHYP